MGSKLKKVDLKAAGIDIGSAEVFVAIDGGEVVSFRTFTSEFLNLVQYLVGQGVGSVAMEATGVYWIRLHDLLEEAGIEVYLVNPSSVKMVPGRKSDVQDCQWLAQLHSYGLLSKSVVLPQAIRDLRQLVRLRDDHIEQESMYINKMQKALVQMNIRLKDVISQVHGVSGMKIVHAILLGERDPEKLSSYCHSKILKAKRLEVIESLRGIYSQASLFELGQAVAGMEFCQEQISQCDQQMQIQLEKLTKELPQIEPKANKPAKAIRWHAPEIEDLHQTLLTLGGNHDATTIPGITDYSYLKILAETGTDLQRWPTAKHFSSWLGLAPGKNQSGKKNHRSSKRIKTKAGQIFKLVARSLLRSKTSAIGEYGRRLRARKGPAIAIKAMARKLAEMYWRIHVHGIEYVEQGNAKYQEQQQLRKRNKLLKEAKKMGLHLADY